MEFTAYHGVYPQEREKGNLFTVDVAFEADTTHAQQSDELLDTIDYSAVHALVAVQMQQPSNLLEHVAQRIKNSIESNIKGVKALEVSVTKHNPPMEGVNKVTVVL